MRSPCWVLAGGFALLGCAPKPAVLPLPAAPAAATESRGVRVSLLWSAPVDLDLYVTDPALETVYFANPESQSGGKLEEDVTCSGAAQRTSSRESIAWTEAPPGRYRVGVDFMESCGGEAKEAEFRLVTEALGTRQERIGRVQKARFEPIVVEFDVPGRIR